jgi:iron complex outermembrane receptor protein
MLVPAYPGHAGEPVSPGDTVSLQDVTISVVPFQEKYGEVTGGVIAISPDRQDLEHTINPSDLINRAPGVYMASGAYNTSRLVIRGVGSRTPYNSNRIRAYLDDIPLTSGDGVTSLEDIDVLGIGSMEILKGPSSALYGSGLGGVVRINSPYPRQKGFTASPGSTFGSFHTARNTVSAGYKNDRLALSSGLSRSFSRGYRENSTYARNSILFNGRYFGLRNTLSLTFNLADLRAEIPSSINETDFMNQPRKAAANWLAIGGYEKYLRVLGGLAMETSISRRLTNKLVLFSTFRDPYETRPFNILDERFVNAGFRETFQAELPGAGFQAGAEYFHEWVDWQTYETLEGGGQGSLLSDHRERRRYLNTFFYAHWKPVNTVVVDAGLNLNILQYDHESMFPAGSAGRPGRYRYDPVLSPRIGINYRFFPGHHLYFAAGHGFSAPSLEETLLPEGTINTELKPETGWNLELGGRGSFLDGAISYDATLYAVRLSNLLVTERLAEDIFTGINAGTALNTGLEVLGRFRPGRAMGRVPLDPEITIGYTLSRNRFTDFVDGGIDYSGKELPGIPSQILNATLTGSMRAIRLDLRYRYTGSQWMNDRNDAQYEGYHLVHIRLGWTLELRRIPLDIELSGGIKNLLDTHYASMILVNAPSLGGNPPRPYYPGLPRRFYGGLTFMYRQPTRDDGPGP